MKIGIVTLAAVALVAAAPTQAAPNRWFGTWTRVLHDAGETPETLIYSDAGGGAMRMRSVEDDSILVTHFDGRPAASATAGKPNGLALAITALPPNGYRWTAYRAGKPWLQGINIIAPDGKSFRETGWRIAEPTKTKTVIYRRR